MATIDFRTLIGVDDTLPRIPVPTPEWPQVDGQMFVRVLTAEERRLWADQATDDEGRARANYMVSLVVACACDREGAPAFSAAEMAWLGGRNGNAVKRMYDHAARVNCMTREAAEAVEKNSEAGPTSAEN
jgi:hypothetical protein